MLKHKGSMVYVFNTQLAELLKTKYNSLTPSNDIYTVFSLDVLNEKEMFSKFTQKDYKLSDRIVI